jgi:SNF2 family DNA or RNA helicase
VTTTRTCGVVRFDEGASSPNGRPVWRIKCEPHVLLRIKRVFGRVAKHAHGTVTLTDGDETARDLLWFLERHPMQIADADRKRLEKRAARHELRRKNVEEVLSDGYEPPAFSLAVTARRYQRLAADMLLRSNGLLLADDVGLGKTASAICTFTDPRTLPALVVTLTHLPRQWELEIGKFAPSLRVAVIKRGAPYDLRDKQGRFPDVVVVNYHKLSGWADALAPHVKSVVFDEAQELRHDVSAKYAAARHVAEGARYRMGLSATPIYNYGGEIFSVLDVLRPGALGVREEFVREWCGGNEAGSDRGDRDRVRIVEPRAFGTYAREQGLMLRRTRAEVGRELPALTKVPHHVDADPEALDRVGPSAAELARIILRQGEERRGQKMQASETLDAILRQATGIAKAPYVADFVRLLVESGERVVLYGWHREVYGIWQDRLRDLDPVMYTGSESSSQKDEARRRFVEKESPVMLMSLRAGAGLDGLQHTSRTIVFGELDWSPGVHEQCIGRVHRDGQREPVVAYFLIAEHGSDPVMADVLGLKKQQIDGLRDPYADLVERLETGGANVKKLAEEYLRQRGIVVGSAVA